MPGRSAPTTQPHTQPDGRGLRVVTLNALWCQMATVEQIAATINRHRPDVVFLQEVHDNQADAFAAALRLNRARTAGLVQQSDSLETALLCRWRLRDVHVLRSPRRAFAVLASAELPGRDGRPAHLISIHQRSTHMAPLREMLGTFHQRLEETTLLLGRLRELAGTVVIGGDFNEGAASASLARLGGRFENAFTRVGHGSPVTFPGFAGGVRIDHFFYTKGDLSAEDCFVDQSALSDHRMVVAVLRAVQEEVRSSK